MQEKGKITSFHKGLNRDQYELNSPEGSYRFALNAVNESKEGDLSTLVSELGNIECLDLPETTYPIGFIAVDSTQCILFLKGTNKNSIILAKPSQCTWEYIVDDTCFGFNKSIQGVSRVLDGCDIIIYFVDDENDDRVINISDILRNSDSHQYLDENGDFDCDLTKNKRNFKVAYIENIRENNSGGNLEYGPINIMLQYEDSYSNQTDYFGDSLSIPVVYGNYSSQYRSVMGGNPILFPPSDKSITFDITNIDESFTYINIIAGYTKDGVTSFYEVTKVPITSSLLTYTLSDLTPDGAIKLTLDKLTTSTNPYDISGSITQTDNRLIKGKVRAKVRDYSEFQRKACEIGVRYVTKAIEHSDSNTSSQSGLSNSPLYYSNYKTRMRDEIYSEAIVWVFTDGTETPAFHIPGREKDKKSRNLTPFPVSDTNAHSRPNNNTGALGHILWDSAYILAGTYSGSINSPTVEYKHFNSSEFIRSGGNLYIERWKAYNTAFRDTIGGLEEEFFTKGELAYFETFNRYPLTKDCNDNYIFPIEDDGEDGFQGQYIRHHKMPDTTLEEHFDRNEENDVDYIIPVGLEFSNIIPPTIYASEIAGYYIVEEKRDVNNQTILDKGVIFENPYVSVLLSGFPVTDYYVQSTVAGRHSGEQNSDRPAIPLNSIVDQGCDVMGYITHTVDGKTDIAVRRDHKSQSFHGALAKFAKVSFTPDAFKVERRLTGLLTPILWENNAIGDLSRYYYSAEYTSSSIIPSQETNRQLLKNPIYIEPDANLPQGYLSKFFLNDNAQETCVFETVDDITFVSSSDTQDDHTDEIGTDPTNVYYGSFKSYNRDIYGQLSLRKYYKTHNDLIPKTTTSITKFGGDCFITKFSFFQSAFLKLCNDEDSKDREVTKCIVTYFIESEVNTELRHNDISNLEVKDNVFWNNYSGSMRDFFSIDWNGYSFNDDVTQGAGAPWNLNTYAKNIYLYNGDYSNSGTIKPYFSLSQSYEFCKECNESFPERIIYSNQGTQEQKQDSFRIFEANNYRDLPANTGEITNLFINFDKLFAHTKQSIYEIITKPYSIETNQTNLFVGTGEFFSISPRELVTTSYGYGGSSCKWGTITTEFGTIYIDDLTGKVFLLGLSDKGQSSNKEISQIGNRNWFEQNIKSNLNEQWNTLYDEDYPYYNQPYLFNGIGFITAYDPRHKRIIITKKDYKIINTSLFTRDSLSNLTDSTIFENLSWTISFSLLSESWISYHSYLPNFYFNDANNFYSAKNANNGSDSDVSSGFIWKHNEGDYLTFYNKYQDFIIEFLNSNVLTNSLDAIYWITNVYVYDDNFKQYIEVPSKTFTKGCVYTTTQSTGNFSINPKIDPYSNYNWSNTVKNASITDGNWKLSSLRDLVTAAGIPVSTSKWSDISSYFDNEGYIDKIPNSAIIDSNKSFYNQADIKDKIQYIRLYFNAYTDGSQENYKFKVFIVNMNDQPSFR